MVRAAVIGGGVFGCTVAVDLARAGAKVDLYEARGDILDGATARCQARLHRGYHYPRSDATATAARDGFAEFWTRYPAAIRTTAHHYVLAPGSKVTPAEYLAFCDRLDLPYEFADAKHVHSSDLVVRVPEAFVDVDMLRRLARRDLARTGVAVHVNQRVDPDELDHDLIVMATYGQPWSKPLRYEVCEVALLELGRYDNESYVVIDGDYVSLDPHRRLHALYDVAHSVHAVSAQPDFPEYADLLSRTGPVRTPVSRVDEMRESASRFLWGLEPRGQGVSIYHGSLFAVRAVLPDVDATDERPTLVERDGRVVSILSGKICTAVTAARTVTDMALVAA